MLTLAIVFLSVYAVAVLLLMSMEKHLVFFPEAATERLHAPVDLALHEEPVFLTAADGIPLGAWKIAARRDPAFARWIIVCHGNAGNLASPGRPELYSVLSGLGLNVLAFDYRGYGESGGEPSEEGLYRDARAAYDWVREHEGAPPQRILLFGHSLGSAVAIELASRVAVAGLIIEGGFTSVPDVGQSIYPFFPVRLIARNRFSSARRIAALSVPMLFLHATHDEVIPLHFGLALFDGARAPKRFVALAGGHNDALAADCVNYVEALRRFLTSAIESERNDGR